MVKESILPGQDKTTMITVKQIASLSIKQNEAVRSKTLRLFYNNQI